MPHLGLICPELSGHLNPMTTLGGELKRRGHRVTLIARPDARVKTESAGLEFLSIGERDFPAGSMARTTTQLGQTGGLNAIRFTAELLRRAAVTILEDAPGVITGARIDGLLVDQVPSAGDTVAEILGLPFVTVCNALALNPEPAVPPAVTPWRYRRGWIWRVRNAVGDGVFRWLAKPILDEINARRLRHGLPQLADSISKSASLAQIAQQPAFFDYPRARLPDRELRGVWNGWVLRRWCCHHASRFRVFGRAWSGYSASRATASRHGTGWGRSLAPMASRGRPTSLNRPSRGVSG